MGLYCSVLCCRSLLHSRPDKTIHDSAMRCGRPSARSRCRVVLFDAGFADSSVSGIGGTTGYTSRGLAQRVPPRSVKLDRTSLCPSGHLEVEQDRQSFNAFSCRAGPGNPPQMSLLVVAQEHRFGHRRRLRMQVRHSADSAGYSIFVVAGPAGRVGRGQIPFRQQQLPLDQASPA